MCLAVNICFIRVCVFCVNYALHCLYFCVSLEDIAQYGAILLCSNARLISSIVFIPKF